MTRTLAALLYGAAGVSALNACRAPGSQTTPAANAVATNTYIPNFSTHTWTLVSPDEALTSLHSKACATPSAISLMSGVTLPTDLASLGNDIGQLVGNLVGDLTDGLLPGKIPNPASSLATPTTLVSTTPQASVATPTSTAGHHHNGTTTRGGNGATSTATSSTGSATPSSTECSSPAVRPEWRNMSSADQSGYVNAIKCLMGKPSQSGLAGAKTRYDDLVAVHQQMNAVIHGVGQFLPWHRYFLHIFEELLQNECSYAGAIPWWDETKDAGNFKSAAPFTSQFEGSMPDLPTACVTDGAFSGYTANIGPGSSNTAHCLARGVNETLSSAITSGFVNLCNAYTDYSDMLSCQFLGPHGYGHDAIGGVMQDVQSSPADPAFFLHHGFVDRNWRVWQAAQATSRTYQIGGSTTQNCGSSCQATTLNYVLSSMNLVPSVTIDQVMDTQGNYLCYYYDY